jgi:hypothetical protein
LNLVFVAPAIPVEVCLFRHGLAGPPIQLHDLRLYIILCKSYSLENKLEK